MTETTPYNGKPRVSTILAVENKPFLHTWRARVGNQEADRVSKEATDLGSEVDAMAMSYMADGKTPFSINPIAVKLFSSLRHGSTAR